MPCGTNCGGWVRWWVRGEGEWVWGGGPRYTRADRDPPCSVRPFSFFLSPLVPYSLSCPPDPQSEEDLSGQSSEIPKVWQVWGLASLSTDTSVQLWALLPLWRWWCRVCDHGCVCVCVCRVRISQPHCYLSNYQDSLFHHDIIDNFPHKKKVHVSAHSFALNGCTCTRVSCLDLGL